jgi:hypothetical protein
MKEQENKEMLYFQSKLSNVAYNPQRFKIMFGDDKFLFGLVSAENDKSPFGKLMQYKTIHDTLIDLDWKIKLSFNEAINFSYSDTITSNFSLIRTDTEEEKLAFYYIENALFRTSSLWDMLAQLYRLFYNINILKEKVYYKQIFNPVNNHSDSFKTKAKEIYDYIEQDDDSDCEGEWKGNHSFANNLRNKMTHRNSPNVAVISDFDMNLKHHPAFQLKRIIEDYAVVSQYIKEILDEIETKVMDIFDDIES